MTFPSFWCSSLVLLQTRCRSSRTRRRLIQLIGIYYKPWARPILRLKPPSFNPVQTGRNPGLRRRLTDVPTRFRHQKFQKKSIITSLTNLWWTRLWIQWKKNSRIRNLSEWTVGFWWAVVEGVTASNFQNGKWKREKMEW